MTTDHETISVYTNAADRYASGVADTYDVGQDIDVERFCALIPTGGHILDLGCGPGQWAVRFRNLGYQVSAIDATPAMADLAKKRYDLDVTVATFADLKDVATYDGIWANFSLLHASKVAFPEHLRQIHAALKPKGSFHIAMKLGANEARDKLGRFYNYYTEDALHDLLTQAGFTVTATRRGAASGLAGDVETYVVMTAHA